VVCPWVDPGKPWTRDDALKTAAAFNRFGKAAQAADLRFAYHCHGYEFLPSPEGTLFDTLAQQTDPAAVTFQMDVFHALLAGTDPVALIARYGSRVSSLHLKDLKKGFPVRVGTATAPAEADVPLGTGEVDIAGVLRVAFLNPEACGGNRQQVVADLLHPRLLNAGILRQTINTALRTAPSTGIRHRGRLRSDITIVCSEHVR
jgi:hypothetical protein